MPLESMLYKKMKHLKTYKIYESNYDIPAEEFGKKNLEIVHTTEDILDEIRDNGLNVDIRLLNRDNGGNVMTRSYGGVCKVSIQIYKLGERYTIDPQDIGDLDEDEEVEGPYESRRHERVNYVDIKHSLDHLNSFLSENGLTIDFLELVSDDVIKCIKFTELEKSLNDSNITWINITWIKNNK